MAQFPITSLTKTAIVDSINFLLSGPTGIGQNFQSYFTTSPAYLTTNLNPPYVTSNYSLLSNVDSVPGTTIYIDTPALRYAGITDHTILVGYEVYGVGIPTNTVINSVGSYVATFGYPYTVSTTLTELVEGNLYYVKPFSLTTNLINLSTSNQINSNTNHFTYAGAPLSNVPLSIGQQIVVGNVSIANYNGSYINVVSSDNNGFSATYYINNGTLANGTGGNISYSSNSEFSGRYTYYSTDCVVNATSSYGTDNVILASKLQATVTVNNTSGVSQNFHVIFSIVRYKVDINNNYVFDKIILQDTTTTVVSTGNSDTFIDETYPSIIDVPVIGTYQYRIELAFLLPFGGNILYCLLRNRSLTVQVVKT